MEGRMAASNRLLIVDDERDINRLIEIPARQLGYDVLAINDTDLFEKSIQQFDPTIIMLDIAMPGRDGVELIGHLSAGGYQGKIVVMSGSHPPSSPTGPEPALQASFALLT
jgi:DNA-binding response OmpR family regulator